MRSYASHAINDQQATTQICICSPRETLQEIPQGKKQVVKAMCRVQKKTQKHQTSYKCTQIHLYEKNTEFYKVECETRFGDFQVV